MKKLFTFLFALIASVGMVFAAKDVVPSDAVLQNYYDPGQLCVCIFIPAEMACNDVVFVGTYNRDASDAWITDVKTLARFEPVEGYNGWYVIAVNDDTPADFQDGKGIQGKPIILDQDRVFSWSYQVGAVTKIRGGVTVVDGILDDEIDLIGYTKDAPNVFTIDALKANANPCTAVYHDYTFTVISDGCEGFAVPYLIGSMTDWGFQQMQVNVEKTQELGAPVYYYKCRCAEGTRYQVLSGLMADDGTIAAEPAWSEESYLQKLVDDVWVRIPGVSGDNQLTGTEAEILIDVRAEDLRWARCAEIIPEDSYTVNVTLTAPAGAPAAGVEIIGEFDGWAGTPMTLENGKYTATVTATASQVFKFREAGTWDNELLIADPEAVGGWKEYPDTQFQSVWEPAAEEGKMVINLDLSNPTMYRWKEIQTISGTCGDNLTWTLVDSVLTISGTGAMADYYYDSPWYDYCSSIKSVIINDGVTSIVATAFSTCSSLTSVTIPNSVTSIGDYAFEFCKSLTSVTIPNSVTSIGDEAFSDCTKLSSVIIPKSVVSIGEDVFGGSYLLSSISVEAGNPVYDSRDNCNAIIETATNTIIAGCPNTIIPNSVTAIGNYAFAGFISITSFDIPNQIVKIGNSAFGGCENLSSVTIPNSVISIGEDAFSTCPSLSTITIPSSVKEIMRDAFWGCSSMSAINFESQIPPTMGVGMFYMNDCSFYVPCGTKDAYVAALNENNTIDESRVIEKTFIASGYCGADSTNLTWELSCDSVLTISGTGAMADYASASKVPWYDYRKAIKSVITTEGVASIGDNVFFLCESLTSVTIPNSVTSIGEDAFGGCNALTSITIPDSVTSIGKRAFEYCYSLASVTIPNSVTSIGEFAFYYCIALTSVTIGNSVTSIGGWAFSSCSSLTSITFEAITPPTIGNIEVFFNTNNCPIYVPCGTKDAYVAALIEYDIDESRVIEKFPYTYSVFTSDSTLGSITITQEPTCTEPLIFRADAAEGYQFAQWSDGNTDNPRTIMLTQNTTFTAEFEDAKYIVIWQDEEGNVIKEDKVMQGEMPEYIGEEPAKDSTAEYSYVFAGWLPRIKPVTENVRYTTYFIPQKLTPEKVYTVNINGENCSLNISNEYPEGAVVTVEAVADDCFKFEKWSDNNTDNPRTIMVTEDSVLTAEFTKLIYTIKGANQSSTGGSVQVVNP